MSEMSYGIDGFAITVLVICFLLVSFFIFVSVYSSNIQQNKYPTRLESQLIFWLSLLNIVILLGLIIYSVYRLISRKVPIEPKDETKLVKVLPSDKYEQYLNMQKSNYQGLNSSPSLQYNQKYNILPERDQQDIELSSITSPRRNTYSAYK